MLGGGSGAEPSLRALAAACVSSCEPASGQFNGSVAVTGTCWLSMVRRRSTVRFPKGAPRSEAFFDTDPVTFARGIPAEGTGQRLGWKPEPSRGRRLMMVRDRSPRRQESAVGGILGGKIAIKRPCLSRAHTDNTSRSFPVTCHCAAGRCPARASLSRPHGPRCRSRRESIHASPFGRTRHGPPQRRGARAGRHHRGARRSG